MKASVPRQQLNHRLAFGGACVVLLLLLIAAYSNSFHNSFHFDDNHVVENNLYIRSLSNLPLFFQDAKTFSSQPPNATYRPMVSATLAIDYWIGGGLDVRQFHVTQLLMLIALGAMVFSFVLRILDLVRPVAWNRFVALAVTAIFTLHTTNTETMNLIHARSELMSLMGVVGAFLVYLYAPGTRRYLLYLLPMVLGALAKTPAVIFAPLFVAYLFLFEERLSLRDLFSSQAWPAIGRMFLKATPALVLAAFLFVAVESQNAPEATYAGGSRFDYLLTQSFVWLHYFRLFFLPIGLTADTDWTLISQWFDTRVIAGALFVALLLRVMWVCSRQDAQRPIAFGVAWFILTLLPASSLFPLAEVANEHRVFFPFVGLALAVVTAATLSVEHWAQRRPQLRGALLTGFVALVLMAASAQAVGTHERNKIWLTEETLWRDVSEKSPANGRGLMNYGLSQMVRGRFVEAKQYFDRAVVINPNYSTLEINLGIVTDRLGRPAEAEPHFKRAIDLQPGYPEAHHFYGNWLMQQGRCPEAVERFREVIRLSHAFMPSRQLLMDIYYAAGYQTELNALVQDTLRAAGSDVAASAYASGSIPVPVPGPSALAYYSHGVVLTNQGNHLQAALSYRQALRFDAKHPESHNNLGWSLAKLGYFREAASEFELAIQLRPDYGQAKGNLAWVLKELAARSAPTGQ